MSEKRDYKTDRGHLVRQRAKHALTLRENPFRRCSRYALRRTGCPRSDENDRRISCPPARSGRSDFDRKMIELQRHMRKKWLMTFAFLCITVATPISSLAEKIKPEEIVARHLESIGPAKARGSARVIAGSAQVIFR